MSMIDPMLHCAIAEVDPELADAIAMLFDTYYERALRLLTRDQPELYDRVIAAREQQFAALHLEHVVPWGSA